MKKPIISICIPTFNRKEQLKIAIDSMISQQPFMDGKVEIVVSDNSQEIDAEELIGTYATERIRYFRNEKNIRGINFAKSLTLGRGTYRKLANDTLCFGENSLEEMVDFVERNMKRRPILLWKTYQHLGIERAETDIFEEAMRLCSYWTTWISSYGIWEEDADDIVDHCEMAAESFRRRVKEGKEGDVLSNIPFDLGDDFPDCLWQLRYFMDSFKSKNMVSLQNCAGKWTIQETGKTYPKGFLKWVFYDYYMSILGEFRDGGYLFDSGLEELQRDVAFSFFVNYMVDMEFPYMGHYYENGEGLIEDIISIYKNKPYYKEFYEYYQMKRRAAMERQELPIS